MPLGELLSRQAQQQPDKKALIFPEQSFSFKELQQQAQSLSKGLIRLGVQAGDRVAILLPNSPAYIYSYFAIFQAGAIAVPINSFLVDTEIQYILENSGTSILITTSKHYKNITSKQALPDNVSHVILTHGEHEECLNIEDVKHNGKEQTVPSFSDNTTPALIIYTSGTTGRPKGAVLTHNNLLSNIQACSQAFPLKTKDRFLVFLPLFHSFTLTVSMLLPIYTGARIILLPGIAREPIKQAIRKERPTIMVGIPAVYNMLAHASISFITRLLNPVKVYISGGAPLPLEVIKTFEAKYHRPLLEGYGLSEASPVVSINPIHKRKPASVGLPLNNVQVKVINGNGEKSPAKEIGELLVKGPNVMQGYWQNPEATSEVIKDGWLHTGDMAHIDKEGYIYIVDRKKELIIVHGMNVYPREIEDILYKHPAVLEAAVIGVPHQQKGEVPKAVMVLKENQQATEEDFKQFCRQHLAAYKIPHFIEFRNELPKTGSGKILKRQLLTNNVRR